MTRKHFAAMAAIVRREITECSRVTEADRMRARHTANAFIRLAEWDNPRFNRERFLAACGLEDKTA